MDFLAALVPGGDASKKKDTAPLGKDGSGETDAPEAAFTAEFRQIAPQQSGAIQVELGEDAAAAMAIEKFKLMRSDPESAIGLTKATAAPVETESPGLLVGLTNESEAEATAPERSAIIQGLGDNAQTVDDEAIRTIPAASIVKKDTGRRAGHITQTELTAPSPESADVDRLAKAQAPTAGPERPVAEIPFTAASKSEPETIASVERAPLVQTKAAPAHDKTETSRRLEPGAPREFTIDKEFRAERLVQATTIVAKPGATAGGPADDAPGPLKIGETPLTLSAAIERVAVAEGEHNRAIQRAAAAQVSVNYTATQIDPARQVIAAIRNAPGAGGESIDVRLDPPDLGRVRIHFNMDTPHAVTATVSSEHGQTLDLLRRNGDDLVKELQRAGFDSINLEFSSHRERGGEFDETPQRAPGDPIVLDTPADRGVVYLSMRDGNHLDRLV